MPKYLIKSPFFNGQRLMVKGETINWPEGKKPSASFEKIPGESYGEEAASVASPVPAVAPPPQPPEPELDLEPALDPDLDDESATAARTLSELAKGKKK